MTEYLNTVPLHYFENGEWVEYDNSLELDDNGNYTNLNSPLSITVPSEINTNSTAELVSNGHTLSISLNNIFDCSENDYIQGSIPKKETLNKISGGDENLKFLFLVNKYFNLFWNS